MTLYPRNKNKTDPDSLIKRGWAQKIVLNRDLGPTTGKVKKVFSPSYKKNRAAFFKKYLRLIRLKASFGNSTLL